MAATVQIDESNGTGEVVQNNISTGNYRGANDSPNLADPLDDPIQVNANSYEKWHRARWSSGAASRLDTWRHYKSDGAVVANTSHKTSADNTTPSNPTYAAPVTTTSTVATFDIPTSDPAVQEIAGVLNATAERTSYVATQVQVGASATVGDLDGEITWAWREIA
jgi:hypothetical protein